MNWNFRRSKIWLRLCVLLTLASLTCFGVIACSSADSASGGSQEVVFATEDDYPPYDFLKDGKHVGYNQELLELVTKDAPFEVKQEILPFQGILTGIATNKYDATNAAIAILEERLGTIDYTMPVTDITNYFIKRQGDPINSVDDMAGKTIGIQQGSVTAQIVAEQINPALKAAEKPEAKTAEYAAFAEAYQDLENGRVDVVMNNLVALTQVSNEKPDVFEILEEPVGGRLYASWAVGEGKEDILQFLNDGLTQAKADGSLEQLQEKWLGVTFDLPDEPRLPGDKPIPAS